LGTICCLSLRGSGDHVGGVVYVFAEYCLINCCYVVLFLPCLLIKWRFARSTGLCLAR
jgi:hypothetical protein